MFATIIDCYEKQIQEFEMHEGTQPTNSIFYIKKGCFEMKIGEAMQIVQAGDLVFFDMQTFFTRRVIEPLEFLYIKFRKNDEVFFPLKTKMFTNLSAREKDDLEKIGSSFVWHGKNGLTIQTHYLNDLILSLCDKTVSTSKMQAKTYTGPILGKAAEYIRRNIASKITIETLAKDVGMSVSSFETKFKKTFGTSVYAYLIEVRFREAMRLLVETNYSVTEIAERCGYSNMFYFCIAFKKRTHLTPTQFRNENRV